MSHLQQRRSSCAEAVVEAVCWGEVVDTRMGHTIPEAVILGPTGGVPMQGSLLINWMSPVSSMRVYHAPPGVVQPP